MAPERRGSFLGWTIVSYFAICGGLMAAFLGVVAGRQDSPWAALAAFAVGAAIGGFFAGRASPHRSYLEPALAGVLVVGSVLGFAYLTPMGRLAIGYGGDELLHAAAVVGGIGLVAGFAGALFGELSALRQPPPGALRWLGMSVLLTAGALFAAATVAAGLLVNDAAEKAIADAWLGREVGRDLFDEERIVVAVALALGAASVVGGFVTQMAAPRRLLLPSAAGALLLVGGAVVASTAAAGDVAEATWPALLTGGVAGLIALVGATIGWILRKAAGTL